MPNEQDVNVELNLPINLGLNDGTICPKSCIDVMQRHNSITSLRNYTTSLNNPVLDTISQLDGVTPDNIYLANGSGPILKQCIPHLVKSKIKSSPGKIFKHLVSKNGFPIVTGRLTYFKVPLKAYKAGLTVKLLPLGKDTNWKLRPEDVADALKETPGLAYICNPNNPTGQLMLTRDEIESLVKRFPDSIFWVDEAYVQYISKEKHQPLSDLVPKYNNLFVSRTFSFAYGLAGVRMGYLLGPKKEIQDFRNQVTDYCFGTLQEQLAIAALTDKEHLPALWEMTARDAKKVTDVLNKYDVEVVPSKTHFLLCRFPDTRRSGKWLAEKLLEKGIKIKHFVPVQDENYDEYFRITLGVGIENDFLCEKLEEILRS